MHRHIRGALCLGATAIAGITAGLAYAPIQAIATGGQETAAVAGADQDGTQAETTEVGKASEPATQQPAAQETAEEGSTQSQEAGTADTAAAAASSASGTEAAQTAQSTETPQQSTQETAQ